jgi:hypothetical protein
MEEKFSELAMMGELARCQLTSFDRDPEIKTIPPRNIVRHVRERGTLYLDISKHPIALIFEWDSPSGEACRSIRWFICGRVKYRLKFRDSGPTQESLSFPSDAT